MAKKKKKGKNAPVYAGISLFVMCAADNFHTQLNPDNDMLWVSWVGVWVQEKIVCMNVCPRKQL